MAGGGRQALRACVRQAGSRQCVQVRGKGHGRKAGKGGGGAAEVVAQRACMAAGMAAGSKGGGVWW